MNTNTKIKEKLKIIISGILDIKPEKIKDEDNCVNDLGADSLDQVELVMSVEEEFNIQIPDDDIENLKTLQDGVNYLEKKLT